MFTVDWTYHNLWSVTWSVWSSLLEGCSGGSRGGSPPLIFGPNWGPKDQKNFVGTPASPPFLYLKVWIRHWVVSPQFLFRDGLCALILKWSWATPPLVSQSQSLFKVHALWISTLCASLSTWMCLDSFEKVNT